MEVPQKARSDRIFQLISAIVIATVAVLLLSIYATRLVGKSHSKTAENNAYLRVQDCKTSLIPATRTPKLIDQCYEVVEKDLNIQLKRYDKEL